MNEKIEELYAEAKQATKIGRMNAPSGVVAKKFAELIVQECADICMEMATKCAGLPGDGALAKDCAYWIKKDFGVEE
jgi:hypothetical protein